MKLHTQELALLCEIIKRKSISPNDASCQQLMQEYLSNSNCDIKNIKKQQVNNYIISYNNTRDMLVFIGHTDVVPPGNQDVWYTDLFTSTIKNNILYARGAADIKSNLCAFLFAMKDSIDLEI